MLVLRIGIDTESFLKHAQEQGANYEEFQNYLQEELCRAIRQEKNDLLTNEIWNGGEGNDLSMFVRDPYMDIKDEQDLKEIE